MSRVSASFVAKGSAFPCGPSGRSCVPTRGCQGSRYSRAPPFCCTSLPPRVCSVFQNAMLLLLRSAALPCSRLQALLPLARLEYSISKRVVHLASRCSAGAQLGIRAGPGAVQQLCDGGGRRGVRRPRVSGLTAFISPSLLSSLSPLSSLSSILSSLLSPLASRLSHLSSLSSLLPLIFLLFSSLLSRLLYLLLSSLLSLPTSSPPPFKQQPFFSISPPSLK